MPSEVARRQEAIQLISWGFRQFENRPISPNFPKIPVLYGTKKTVDLEMDGPKWITLPRAASELKFSYSYTQPLYAPLEKGSSIGKIIITSSGIKQHKDYLLKAAETIKKGGVLTVLFDWINQITIKMGLCKEGINDQVEKIVS